MYRLSSIILILFGLTTSGPGQSPHGDLFKVDCASCHSPLGWEISIDTFHFNHDTTQFKLQGTHQILDCKSCHTSLIFDEAPMDCASCHKDIHSMSVGNDCVRCHNSSTWLVDDIPELHEENGFPLIGVHANITCVSCHLSETQLRFDRIGNDCINCHLQDYTEAKNPDHVTGGYSRDCTSCHNPFTGGWDTDIVRHDFFPLTLGHDIEDCRMCHLNENYSEISADCISCHTEDFDATRMPDHKISGFSNDCTQCHTTNPGWQPAEFQDHDNLYFPIYSGAHQGEWVSCIDCHTIADDFTQFSCVNCHERTETDEEHEDVTGYVYEDNACLACHPNGDSETAFNHDNTGFPLTGEHIGVDCLECHVNGFEGTSPLCVDCHNQDFMAAVNPNHVELNLPNDCASCHTTDPDWMPASFEMHDEFYPLLGAHAAIANDCARCHNGDYNNTPNTCVGCHLDDFNNTVDPNHQEAQFSTDCLTCHNEEAWIPATFDHDAQHFPIYSGAHQGEWTACIDCHHVPGDFSQFTCIQCHSNPETDDGHEGVLGYTYNDNACLACHPNGDADMPFDHNTTQFPLTGAHIGVDCLACHEQGFQGTSTACIDCHTADYNTAINPNHIILNLSTDCASCHTTAPDWEPASFEMHDDFYPLLGSHAAIANDCIQCHNGDYNSTPNTCVGCHLDDFNGTTNPNHQQAHFSTDCMTCHNETAWLPSTFDHDGQFFPIYSGAHMGEWMECIDCHTNINNYSEVQCINCHLNPETDDKHIGVNGYLYNDNACLACHPNGDADMPFDHNATMFPLTGAHIGVNCLECHTNGFENTPFNCIDCHTQDFMGSLNPNHNLLNIPTDCASCHSTEPDWMPATFNIHDDYYPLNGAHALIANDCATCHNGDYNNTPNSCAGCHIDNYNATTNPNHMSAQFSTDCATCHGEVAWVPATFDHDGQYFPIYSGAHNNVWAECIECHINPANYSEVTCVACHLNPDTDNEHVTVNGYVYADYACLACHPDGSADMAFDHNATMFPLTGAHIGVDCLDCHMNGYAGTSSECVDCHTDDYNASTNPNHSLLAFPMDCASCHTTEPGWTPASFDIHDNYYPLTGEHLVIAAECVLCHNGDYTNTPNDCVGCHQADFDQSLNPNHPAINIPTDCVNCHTTDADWMPASFDIHDDYYVLEGAHAVIANDCIACHNGDYNNTPNTCIGCHQDDYDNTTNPDHNEAQFSNDCLTCHTQDAWIPSTFDHDGQYFPIYSGAHQGEWVQCIDCHINPNDYAIFTCIGCHLNPETDNEHNGIGGYIYEDNACLACHPTGESSGAIDHNTTNFPLTGAHITVDCMECHINGYSGTPTDCYACHDGDYNGSTNPNHGNLGLDTDCVLCHTTEPGWMPATFDVHDDYYPLTGAHLTIAAECALCHNGDYNNTPTSCEGCHMGDYNQSTNPNHLTLAIPTDCASCHTTTPGWMPATFDIHDDYYPLTGGHLDVADDCILCHNGDYNNTPNSCDGCHLPDYNQSINPDHQNLNLPTDCASCHTTDPDWMPATFDIHDDYYPLNGAHDLIANDCVACHNGDYVNTPNTCVGCHLADYNNTTNPDHTNANFSTDCFECHSEDAWIPSTFDHDAIWPLNGAHAAIANDCNACHMGDFTNTPNTCVGCHQTDYDNTDNPDHAAAQFPTDCISCHNEDAWTPSSWDHDDQYFPIYSGKHDEEWNLCIDCHINASDYTIFSCIDCHEHDDQPVVDDDHEDVSGYIYESGACYACHPTGEK